jgi:lysophospholipid acyltransferase (LPLAT)-like uncharacterized protein
MAAKAPTEQRRTPRQRFADSPAANRGIAWIFATYIRLVWRTSRIQQDGWDEIQACLDVDEPVIIVLWHQRLMLSPYVFDVSKGPFCSLTSPARAGRFLGHVQQMFGFETIPMEKNAGSFAATRTVLQNLRKGGSAGIAADGPRGPTRTCKLTPIVWARSAQKPVFVYAYSVRRYWAWPTWDHQMFPLPFNRGAMIWRRWDQSVPRKILDQDAEDLAVQLGKFIDEVTFEADKMAGHSRPQL